MDEIIPHVYIGDLEDGRQALPFMAVLCVMWEGEPDIPEGAHHIQTTDFNGLDDPYTRVEDMERAADYIHQQVTAGQNVLVHCAYGAERSPLTVAWYLMRYHKMNLSEAYTLIMEKRIQVQYRRTWLPKDVRLSGQLPERV